MEPSADRSADPSANDKAEARDQRPPAVLCATDDSPAADQAARIATALARALGARLELLHVIPTAAYVSAEAVELMGALRDAAEAALARKVDALSGRGVEVVGRVEFGAVDQTLLAAVAARGPRLLVLGGHAPKGLRRSLGGVLEGILGHTQCPVLVIPEPPSHLRAWAQGQRPLRITAGVDLSLASEAVAGTLRMLAQATPCTLDLVHLFWPPREHQRVGLAWSPEQQRPDPWVQDALDRELHARLGHLIDWRGHAASLRLRPLWGDDPAPLITEAREQKADLLVVGVNRHGRGSTALASLRAAALPVLCVPSDDPVEHDLRSALPPVRRVLVPIDFSPLSIEAIPQAYRLVPRGGVVVLAHVADPGTEPIAPEVLADLEKHLGDYVPAQASAAGIATHSLVYESRATAEGILYLARRLGVDLVVMSSHGRSGVQRALMGSVTDAVVRDAGVPVVVVPSRRRLEI